MVAGPALNAFRIFHSSECADVVNVPCGKGAVAVDRSSAEATDEIAIRLVARYKMLLIITISVLSSPGQVAIHDHRDLSQYAATCLQHLQSSMLIRGFV